MLTSNMNKKLHIILASIMLIRFINIIYQCFWGGEVPFYAVFIFSAPSGIAFLFETCLLRENQHRKKYEVTGFLAFLNLGIQTIIGIYALYMLADLLPEIIETKAYFESDLLLSLLYLGIWAVYLKITHDYKKNIFR